MNTDKDIVLMDTTTEEVVVPSMKTQVGLGNVDNTADSVKNVLSATKLTTPRNITVMGITKSFDGSSNISFNSADIGAVTLDEVKKLISDSNTSLMQKLYPIGSIKLTFANINPGTIIPNTTWELESKGAYLRGIDPSNTNLNSIKTGGSNTIDLSHNHAIAAHTHTLNHTHTIASHTHTIAHSHSINGHSHAVNSHAHTTPGFKLTTTHMPSHNGHHNPFRSARGQFGEAGKNGVYILTGQAGQGQRASGNATAFDIYYSNELTVRCEAYGGNASHAHGNTGAATPNTNAVALTTNSGGGNSGGTALTTASGGGTTSGTALTTGTWAPSRTIEPVYQTVYVWKRTA